MMRTSNGDLPPQKSLQIKQDDKFFSRLLSKENSMRNSSTRVYYAGASGAVPFMWESQPGTPKRTFCDTSLPPLTPPPSYHFNPNKTPIKKHSRSNLLYTIFHRLTPRKTHASPSFLSSPSWSSSYSSSSTSTSSTSNFHGRRKFSCERSSFDSKVDDEVASPTSTLCFGVDGETTGGFRGCYIMVIKKNALSSIFSHGSRQGTA